VTDPTPERPLERPPVPAQPGDAMPADSVPVDSVPVDSVPVDSVPVDSVQATSVRVRRAPRLTSFLVVGLAFGVLLAIIATFAFPPNDEFATTQVFGFLLLFGAVLGTALGAVVALLVGRVLDRRTREVSAERESSSPAPDA
jgi:hypothetical protein